MRESRIPDHGNGGKQSAVGSPFGHRDRSPHVHTRVNRPERRQGSEGIATDITEYLAIFILLSHFVKHLVHVAVAATGTQRGRPGNHTRTGIGHRSGRQPQSRTYIVRGQLARTGQLAAHAAFDLAALVQQPAQLLFDERLAVLEHQNFIAFGHHAAKRLHRQWILRNFQHRPSATFRIILHQVIVSNTAGDHSPAVARPVAVVRRCA